VKIDLQTAKELELQKDDMHGLSIFEMVDFTSTPGGKYKLKALFRKPFGNVDAINRNQEAVMFIQENIKLWELPIDTQLTDALDVYYFSDSTPSIAKNYFARFIESISYRFIYKDFSKTFLTGTKHVLYFIKRLDKFRKQIKSEQFPVLLIDYFKAIDEVLDDTEISKALLVKSINKLKNTELLGFDKIFRDTGKDKIMHLIDIVYELDVLISQAKANNKYKLVFPEFLPSEETTFKTEGLYHLFVNQPIDNKLAFSDKENFIFLTGPNMAGKTTFLKACGVAVFMAHIGMGVPAKTMKLSYFSQLFTSLNVSDNLPKGYSYFYSEVRRVKDVAKVLRENKTAFIIFDELFKGTNVKDAFEGSLRIIRQLSKWESCLFLLSSHLLELGKELKTEKSIRFMYFDSQVVNGKPVFNYKIKEGLSDERLGMLILENEGVFDMLKPTK
jgi:DNA mismatch repair ATPase MutS